MAMPYLSEWASKSQRQLQEQQQGEGQPGQPGQQDEHRHIQNQDQDQRRQHEQHHQEQPGQQLQQQQPPPPVYQQEYQAGSNNNQPPQPRTHGYDDEDSLYTEPDASSRVLLTPTPNVVSPPPRPPTLPPPEASASTEVPLAYQAQSEKTLEAQKHEHDHQENAEDLPPAYTPTELYSPSAGSTPAPGQSTGYGAHEYPPEKVGLGGNVQQDAAEWYGHELAESGVLEESTTRPPLANTPPQSSVQPPVPPPQPDNSQPQLAIVPDQPEPPIPVDNQYRPARGSISGDGRVNFRVLPNGGLGIQGREPTIPELTTPTPVRKKEERSSLSALSSLSSLLQSQNILRRKREAEKEGRPLVSTSPVPPYAKHDSQLPPITPRLNIVMQIIGSRGDVQPFLSLALVLAKEPYNHRIRVATHSCFEAFVNEVARTHNLNNGGTVPGTGSIEFFPLAGDPAVLMSYMVRNPGLIPSTAALSGGEIRERRRGVWEILVSTWASCHASYTSISDPHPVPFVADLIVANPPGFGHIHCGERLGVPVHIMFTMPWAPPTSAFPHPLANLPEGRKSSVIDEATINYLTYSLLDILTWQGTGDLINKFRCDVLRLDALNNVHAPTMMGRLATEGSLPHTYCWSPALIPRPKDWDIDSISVSGFWFLDLNSSFVPPPPLAEFLAFKSDKPLIYIGFGSIVAPNPEFLTTSVLHAVRTANVRALISRGWGTINPPEGYSNPDVFFVENTPHDWLFPHVSLAVHHGGAGTTAAAIKAGIPSAIVPFFGDQQFWGDMVTKRGAGGVLKSKDLTGEKLAALITSLLAPGVFEKAKELGYIVNKEQGEQVAATGLLRGVEKTLKGCEVEARLGFVEPDIGLATFTIIPQHPVVAGEGGKEERRKRTKNKTGIRVSSRVAYVLWKAGVINVDNPKEVRLTRWIEWDDHIRKVTETDPATGGAGAILGTIIAMGMAGGVDFDRDTWFAGQKEASGKSSGNNKGKSPAGTEKGKAKETPDNEKENEKDASTPAAGEAPPIISSHREILEAALATTKPIGSIISAGLKSPIDFTLSVSRGFHQLPTTLFQDTTVRPLPPVHSSVKGIGSGVNVATKHLAHGLYDGITGLVTQPIKGFREGGAPGLIRGIASGIGGVVAKPAAGAFGVPGYLGMGVMKQVERFTSGNGKLWEVEVRKGRLQEGEREAQVVASWGDWQKNEIVRAWKEMSEAYLKEDLVGRKGTEKPTRPEVAPDGSGSHTKSFLSKFGKQRERKLDNDAGTSTRSLPPSQTRGDPLEYRDPFASTSSNPNYSGNAGYNEDEALEKALRESLSISSDTSKHFPTHHEQGKYRIPDTQSEPVLKHAHNDTNNNDDDDPELRAAILASLNDTQQQQQYNPQGTHDHYIQDTYNPHLLPTSQQTGIIDSHGQETLSANPSTHITAPPSSGAVIGEFVPPHTSHYRDDWDTGHLSDVAYTPEDSEDEGDEELRRVLEESRRFGEEEENERRRREEEVMEKVLKESLAQQQ